MEMRTLNNGYQIPALGFGTYKSTTGDSQDVLKTAIEAGYRYFDTASFYGNEEELGDALRESRIPREEFILTSKVWKTEMGYENTKAAFEESLKRLQTHYLDMYLIHWPKADLDDERWPQKIADTWRAMEELYEKKKIRAIGVSNFLPHHLDVVLEYGKVSPAVDQLEIHPGYIQREAVEYCKKKGILVQAWSPLGRMRVMQNELLIKMAEKYGVSVAQLCLRFDIQYGTVPLPKASVMERMKQNMDVFDFEIVPEDMEAIIHMPQTGWSGEHPDRERVIL